MASIVVPPAQHMLFSPCSLYNMDHSGHRAIDSWEKPARPLREPRIFTMTDEARQSTLDPF